MSNNMNEIIRLIQENRNNQSNKAQQNINQDSEEYQKKL